MRGGRGNDDGRWIELAEPYLVLCISMLASLERSIGFSITILHVYIVNKLDSKHLRVCSSSACWMLNMCNGRVYVGLSVER